MRTFTTLFVLGVTFTSCHQSNSDSITPESLTGVWIEKTARQDTLLFNMDRSGKPLPSTILVNRGKAPNAAGDLLPKIGSGYWGYHVKPDSITVGSALSSSSRQSTYAFRREDNQILIGNFFELGFNQPATATRTLVRL